MTDHDPHSHLPPGENPTEDWPVSEHDSSAYFGTLRRVPTHPSRGAKRMTAQVVSQIVKPSGGAS